MEKGLAHNMVYSTGNGQNTSHFYAGLIKTTQKKKKHKKKTKSSCNS